MEPLNKILLLAVVALSVSACGVKGRPLPPLNPAPLGRGEPTFKDASQAPNPKKKSIKKNQDDEAAAETEEP